MRADLRLAMTSFLDIELILFPRRVQWSAEQSGDKHVCCKDKGSTVSGGRLRIASKSKRFMADSRLVVEIHFQ
jgi:hypothetical protein